MKRASRWTLASVAAVCLASATLLAVDADKAMYVGGTITGLKEKTEGRLSTASETHLLFQPKGAAVSIPYESITSMEYGQKAGRRVGVAIMISPLALFSKKRNHFLTLTYKDASDKEQAAVFELGKNIMRPVLTVMQVRTGKKIEYQDLEACKQFKTPKDCEADK